MTDAAALAWLEAVAVGLGLAYILLAAREQIACWYAAFVSTAISVYLFWEVTLPLESALNVYYMGMAGYGWWVWRSGESPGAHRPIVTWPLVAHVWALAGIVSVTWVLGTVVPLFTAARWPFLDAFTTTGAVLTTWMVARKVLENWLYWLVIDAASIALYLDRGLYLYATLFALYLIIAVYGFRAWRIQLAAA